MCLCRWQVIKAVRRQEINSLAPLNASTTARCVTSCSESTRPSRRGLRRDREDASGSALSPGGRRRCVSCVKHGPKESTTNLSAHLQQCHGKEFTEMVETEAIKQVNVVILKYLFTAIAAAAATKNRGDPKSRGSGKWSGHSKSPDSGLGDKST